MLLQRISSRRLLISPDFVWGFIPALKRLSCRDYDSELTEIRADLARNETEVSVKQREVDGLSLLSQDFGDTLNCLQEQIISIPKEAIDIKNVKSLLKDCASNIDFLEDINKQKQGQLEQEEEFLQKISNFRSSYTNFIESIQIL